MVTVTPSHHLLFTEKTTSLSTGLSVKSKNKIRLSGQRVRWPGAAGKWSPIWVRTGYLAWGWEHCKKVRNHLEVRLLWERASSGAQTPNRMEQGHPFSGSHPSPSSTSQPQSVFHTWCVSMGASTLQYWSLLPSCPLTFKNLMNLSRLKCFIEVQWWWYHWGNKSSTNKSWV